MRRGHVRRRLAHDRLRAGAGAGLERRQHRGAVGQPAVRGGAVRVGVGGHDPGAAAHRPEGRQQLRVVEAAVPGDDHHRRLVRVGGQP